MSKPKHPNFFLHLSPKCMPTGLPIFSTMMVIALAYVPEVPLWILCLMTAFLVLFWIKGIAYKLIAKDVDIFQHWREYPEPFDPMKKEPTQ